MTGETAGAAGTLDFAETRHSLYCNVRLVLASLHTSSEGSMRDELMEAIRSLDGLYALGPRLCVGCVDGDPDGVRYDERIDRV